MLVDALAGPNSEVAVCIVDHRWLEDNSVEYRSFIRVYDYGVETPRFELPLPNDDTCWFDWGVGSESFLAWDADGYLYLSGRDVYTDQQLIYKISPDGEVVSPWPIEVYAANSPVQVSMGGDGWLYAVYQELGNTGPDLIYTIDPQTGAINSTYEATDRFLGFTAEAQLVPISNGTGIVGVTQSGFLTATGDTLTEYREYLTPFPSGGFSDNDAVLAHRSHDYRGCDSLAVRFGADGAIQEETTVTAPFASCDGPRGVPGPGNGLFMVNGIADSFNESYHFAHVSSDGEVREAVYTRPPDDVYPNDDDLWFASAGNDLTGIIGAKEWCTPTNQLCGFVDILSFDPTTETVTSTRVSEPDVSLSVGPAVIVEDLMGVVVDRTNRLTGDSTIEFEWWDRPGLADYRSVRYHDIIGDGLTNPRQLRVAALGDSFMSGEGAGFAWNDGSCHRSDSAYPKLLDESNPLVEELLFVACTGATTEKNLGHVDSGGVLGGEGKNGEGLQLQALRDLTAGGEVDAVLLSIGGNNAGFSTFVTNCLLGQCVDEDAEKAWWYHQAESIFDDVVKAIADARAVGAEGGETPEVYLFGYPDIVDPSTPQCWDLGDIDYQEREWVAEEFVPYLNSVLEAAARRAGAYFVDLSATFDGYWVCTDRAYANGWNPQSFIGWGSWVTSPFVPSLQNWFHPNPDGHAAIYRTFDAQYGGILGVQGPREPDPSVGVPGWSETLPDPTVSVTGIESTNSAGFYYRLDDPESLVETFITGGFAPGSEGQLTGNSDPVDLGTATADAEGNLAFDVTFPAGLEPGHHTLVVTGTGANEHPRTAYATIGIVAAEGDADDDTVADEIDNCTWVPNPDQADADGNSIGDACDDTDHITLQSPGPLELNVDDFLASGDITIGTDGWGPATITGTGTIPDGTTFDLALYRFLIFPVHIGWLTLETPGQPERTVLVWFTPTHGVGDSVTGSSAYIDFSIWPWQPGNLTWTLTDRR